MSRGFNVEVWIESANPGRVKMIMPDTYYTPGDTCWLDIWYAHADAPSNYPLFLILEAYGNYYMGPSFTGAMDYYSVDADPLDIKRIIPVTAFNWPGGTGSGYGLKWYTAMTDRNFNTLTSNLDTWEFDYGN